MTTPDEPAMTASGAEQEPKGGTKPGAAPRKSRIAPSKPKSRKQTTPAKKAAKGPQKATSAKAEAVRKGSKSAKVLDLLKRRGGATIKELMKATGWQPHSLRGFLSGRKKMGLTVASTRAEDGERRYFVKA